MGQFVHAAAFTEGAYCPPEQGLHPVDTTDAANMPATHPEQPVAPETAE